MLITAEFEAKLSAIKVIALVWLTELTSSTVSILFLVLGRYLLRMTLGPSFAHIFRVKKAGFHTYSGNFRCQGLYWALTTERGSVSIINLVYEFAALVPKGHYDK